MTKLFTIAATAALAVGLSACSAPAEDENATTGPDVATVSGANSDVVGNASDAPGMETLQMAINEACPTVRAQLRSATCDAANLGQDFTCTYSYEQDPEGAERDVTLTQANGGWMIESDPKYCDPLSRADSMAGTGDDAMTGSDAQ